MMDLKYRCRGGVGSAVLLVLVAAGLAGCAVTQTTKIVIPYIEVDQSNVEGAPTAVTTELGAQIEPALSRDGRWLLYSSQSADLSSNFNIKRVCVGGGAHAAPYQMTDSPEGEYWPQALPDQPDGSSFICTRMSNDRGFLFMCGASGNCAPVPSMLNPWESPRRVGAFSVSPDGNEVVYETWDTDLNVRQLFEKSHKQDDTSIFLKSLDQMQGDERICSGRRPAWHPGGQVIAFAKRNGARSEIHTIDIATGEEQVITGGAEAQDDYPSWSPDGRWLVFSRVEEGSWNLYKIRADGKYASRLTTAHPSDEVSPIWGLNRTIFFQSNFGGGWDIWSLRLLPEKN